MGRNAFAEILKYQPNAYGRFSYEDERGGGVSCSGEGMDQLIHHARIMEHWAGHFEALSGSFTHCAKHGLSVAEFGWAINDYICEPMRDPAHVDFLLADWHEETDGFCVAAWAHSVPAGLLVEFEAGDGQGREVPQAAAGGR